MAYPYCRAYDRISLKCNGELMHANVSKDEAPQPPNPGSEVPITVCFTVSRAYLDRAKRLDQKLHFSYTVTDQIGNGPDPDASWSPVQTVDEDLDGMRLPMPILLERMEDFPGDDGSIIDLEKLAGNPLLVIVVTADKRFQVGDNVEATYTAKLAGQADIVVTVKGTVEADPFGQKKPCVLDVANDKVLAGSDVTMTYELFRPNGDRVGNSKTAAAQVVGAAAPDLERPTVKQAPDNTTLNPFAAKNGLTVIVPAYANMVGTQLSVSWIGTSGGGSRTSQPVNVITAGAKEIAIPHSVVAFNLGNAVKVFYTVTQGGVDVKSKELGLAVQKIADGHAGLPKPGIDRAVSSELDVSRLKGDEQLRVAQWPLQVSGQGVWLRYDGVLESGTTVSKVIWEGPPHHSHEGLMTLAPIDWLRGLKDGSELKVEFKVNFDGRSDKDTAVTFPVRTYTVKAVEDVKPTIDSVIGKPSGAEVPDGSTISETTVELTGKATPNFEVEIFDGETSHGKVGVNVGGEWRKIVSELVVGAHGFKVRSSYGTQPISEAYAFSVIAINRPKITSIRGRVYITDNQPEIPHNSEAAYHWVFISGTGAPGSVELYDGTQLVDALVVNADGKWSSPKILFTRKGVHEFTAKSSSVDNPVSEVYRITKTTVSSPHITGSTPIQNNMVRYTAVCSAHPITRGILLVLDNGTGYTHADLPAGTTLAILLSFSNSLGSRAIDPTFDGGRDWQ